MNILGMALLKEKKKYDSEGLLEELKNKWNLVIEDVDVTDDNTMFFTLEGYQIVLSYMQMPIPDNEVESIAEFNYFWKNGVEESKEHKAHILIVLLNAGENLVKENFVFTMLTSAVLNHSESIGIYLGNRTLTLSKEFYQINADIMLNNEEIALPIYNWIYFGLRSDGEKYSIYTYGMYDFNKKEMEIINSEHDFEHLLEMMFNFVDYVLRFNVDIKDGETIGLSEEQKLKITESDGVHLEGKTLKIEY